MEKGSNIQLNLLLISHTLFLTYSLLGHVPIFSEIFKMGTMIAIALLLFNFLLQNRIFKFKDNIGYFAMILISLVHSFFSNNFGFFKLMLFAGSMKTINFKKVVKYDLYLRVVLIILVVILCNRGIIPDKVYMYNGMLRRSMGFTNPNTLGIAVFVLVCDILYVGNMKISFKTFFGVSAVSFWLYSVARCRTAALIIMLIMVVALFYSITPRFFNTKIVRFAMYALPIVFIFITFIVVNEYIRGNEVAYEINDFLSDRVKSIVRFVEALSPTFFGQPINETIDKTLDNTYAFVWYDLGMIVSMCFLIAYFVMIKRNKEINTKLCLIMLAFAGYGLTEHLWINVDYNVFMLAFVANPMLEYNDENVEKIRRFKFSFRH